MLDKVNRAFIGCQNRVRNFLTAKNHGDSQLVVALVLIAVAVGLCVVFQSQLKSILDNLLTTVKEKINTLVNLTNN